MLLHDRILDPLNDFGRIDRSRLAPLPAVSINGY